MATETELKVRIDNPEAVRERLRARGAELVQPRVLEDNRLFDDCGRSLLLRGEVLRLRTQAREALLTWKGPKSVRDGIRSREELELGVPEPAILRQILARLGLRPVFRYQKYRDCWRLGDALVMLDETPVGHFLEVEAEEEAVRRVVVELDLAQAPVVEDSYPTLFRRLLSEAGDPADEMVFRASP